jgi:hypothetical protein
MTNGIYIPYFYIIQEVSTSMYYAGVKWAQGCHPNQLLKEDGYHTSSETIKKIIDENGLDTFIIRKIRTFETADEAYNYETRFLQKVNARKHPKFYNGHNNDFSDKFLNIKDIMVEKYGVENASQLEEVKQKKKKTTMSNHGVENPFQLKHVREKVKSNNIEKYGVEYLLCSAEFKEKSTNTLVQRYGVENPFQLDHVRENRDKAMLEKYGTTCSLEIPEIREKAESTMETRYGYKYSSQVPEIKERKRNLQKEKSQRSNVKIIREYCRKFGLKLGTGWYLKSDKYVEEKLNELIAAYGLLVT